MSKKTVATVTLVAFVVFNCSCYSVRMAPAKDLEGARGRGANILAVITRSGETIEFGEQSPGWVREDQIEGYVSHPAGIALAKPQISQRVHSAGGRTTSVWTTGGEKYAVISVTADTADSLSFIGRALMTVPLTEAYAVSVKRADTAGPLVAMILVSVVAWSVVTDFNQGFSFGRDAWGN